MTVQRTDFDCLSFAAVLFVMVAPASAAAQSAESFYKGKTVTVAIGSGVGGSHDQWGRLAARHMGKHIPGQPNLVPKNYPGAGKRGITFVDGGRKTEARVSDDDTQITKAGEKIEAAGLAEGMLCEITDYGDKGTAAKIACD